MSSHSNQRVGNVCHVAFGYIAGSNPERKKRPWADLQVEGQGTGQTTANPTVQEGEGSTQSPETPIPLHLQSSSFSPFTTCGSLVLSQFGEIYLHLGRLS